MLEVDLGKLQIFDNPSTLKDIPTYTPSYSLKKKLQKKKKKNPVVEIDNRYVKAKLEIIFVLFQKIVVF